MYSITLHSFYSLYKHLIFKGVQYCAHMLKKQCGYCISSKKWPRPGCEILGEEFI